MWPVPYPQVDVRSRFGSTHVVICGPETAPPLVLLHGYMAILTMWWPNIAAFSRDFRVNAIDVMGQPGKSRPAEPIGNVTDFVSCRTPRLASSRPSAPIDYTKRSFVERIRELTGDGVDVVLDGIGGTVALGSYRSLRRGGRLVMYGHYGTTVGRRKSARRIALFYLAGALVFAGNLLPNRKRVRAFQVAKLRDRHPAWFREDAAALFELLAERKIAPLVAERIPLADARRAHENLGRGGITGKQVLICDENVAGVGHWARSA